MTGAIEELKEGGLDLITFWIVVWEKLWPIQVYVLTAVVWFFVGYLGLKAV